MKTHYLFNFHPSFHSRVSNPSGRSSFISIYDGRSLPLNPRPLFLLLLPPPTSFGTSDPVRSSQKTKTKFTNERKLDLGCHTSCAVLLFSTHSTTLFQDLLATTLKIHGKSRAFLNHGNDYDYDDDTTIRIYIHIFFFLLSKFFVR